MSQETGVIALFRKGQYQHCLQIFHSRDISDENELKCIAASAFKLKKYPLAEEIFQSLVRKNPADTENIFNLSRVYEIQNKIDSASQCYRDYLLADSNNSKIKEGLARLLSKNGDYEESRQILDQIDCADSNLEILYLKAYSYYYLDQLEVALRFVESTLNLNANHSKALYLKAQILIDSQNMREAIILLQRIIQVDPKYVSAYNLLAAQYRRRGELSKAVECYQYALSIDPNNPMIHSNLLFILNCFSQSAESLFLEHQKWHLAQVKDKFCYSFEKQDRKLIHLAYLSSDFRNHSVAFFMESIVAQHDRKKFRVILFSDVKKPNEKTEYFKHQADDFYSVSHLSDQQLADKIHSLQIDILVELNGHTGKNRLRMLAMKPAPIQMSYLGYPNTTGLPEIDYRITDSYVDLPGVDQFYSEKLIRLENVFLNYNPPDIDLPVKRVNSDFTLGCFNNLAKLTDSVLSLWAQIMKNCPEAKLLLKSFAFHDSGFCEDFLKRCESLGFARDQIKFLSWQGDLKEHLSLYNQVDLALDPFPYNGTTTTFEALWMNTPVLCLKGESHRERVSYSINHNLNLNNFISETTEDYVKIATHYYQNQKELLIESQKIRGKLLNSAYCQNEVFIRDLESCYSKVWGSYCD